VSSNGCAMRKLLYLVAAGTLTLALGNASMAQNAVQKSPSTVLQPNVRTAAPNCCSSQSDQPVSLGDLARIERAKRKSEPKAVKIFDDDNMPRAPLTAGQKAPDLAGQESPGGPQAAGSSGQTSPRGGKVRLLDFWATWCGPCRRSLPSLKELAATYAGQDLEIIGVDEDDDRDAWQSFVSLNGMTWTQQFDEGHQMIRDYGANALPTYVLIGRDGNVVGQYVGYDSSESLAERIGPDLKKSLEGGQ